MLPDNRTMSGAEAHSRACQHSQSIWDLKLKDPKKEGKRVSTMLSGLQE